MYVCIYVYNIYLFIYISNWISDLFRQTGPAYFLVPRDDRMRWKCGIYFGYTTSCNEYTIQLYSVSKWFLTFLCITNRFESYEVRPKEILINCCSNTDVYTLTWLLYAFSLVVHHDLLKDTPVSTIYIYIWSEIFWPSTRQKVKPNMAGMEALSYVGFSPPTRSCLRVT